MPDSRKNIAEVYGLPDHGALRGFWGALQMSLLWLVRPSYRSKRAPSGDTITWSLGWTWHHGWLLARHSPMRRKHA